MILAENVFEQGMCKALLLAVIALLASGCSAVTKTASSPATPTVGASAPGAMTATGSNPTTPSAVAPAPGAATAAALAPDRCADSDYLRAVGCHLQAASTLNQAINQACSNYLAPQCASAIGRYQSELLAAQHGLARVSVPASLGQANSSLHAAMSTDLTACGQALEAINAHDLSGFLGAVSTHISAGSLLTRAWSQALSAMDG